MKKTLYKIWGYRYQIWDSRLAIFLRWLIGGLIVLALLELGPMVLVVDTVRAEVLIVGLVGVVALAIARAKFRNHLCRWLVTYFHRWIKSHGFIRPEETHIVR